jgi:flavin-binding protein dodecin
MKRSTYKVIEIIVTSDTSWEDAVRDAIETAVETVRDLRIV